MSLALLLALVALVPSAKPAAAHQDGVRQEDALTGLWEGRGTGSDPVPPEGISFSLRLERKDDDVASAILTMEGIPPTAPVEAEFDAATGELTFRCDLTGIQVDVELVIAGEELHGKASGLGMSVELRGKRTTRTPPPLAAPPPPRARVDLATLGPDAWREDLTFLAAELPRCHANAFHALTKEQWEERVRALDARLPKLDPAASAVALAQLVAAVGDAHTELGLGGPPFDRFVPLGIRWFEDGLFVTAVDRRFESVLAGRVRRVGRMSAEEAFAAASTLFAHENDYWARAKAPSELSRPALLAALGVTESPDSIPLVVAGPDGEDVSATITLPRKVEWVVAPDPALVPPPLWQQRTGEGYWFAPTADGRALYCAYNRCAEDPARPMKAFMDELFAALARPGVERLVIDLRHNSGGNSGVLSVFLPALAAQPCLATSGSLRVLIGSETYSSGMTNAFELRDRAHARLFGEPTGGKPNSYGELRVFTLPRSGLEVYHSTKYFADSTADADAVQPDVRVPMSSADYFAGVDPVLERALRD